MVAEPVETKHLPSLLNQVFRIVLGATEKQGCGLLVRLFRAWHSKTRLISAPVAQRARA
jgi:hypothetical protein